MTQDQSLQVVRHAFAHITDAVIVVEDNDIPDMPAELIVKVYVRADQLDFALGDEYGSIPRQAAIDSGMSVEVALHSERKQLQGQSATLSLNTTSSP